MAKTALLDEIFIKDIIHAGIIEDITLLPDEPNLSWFTYRNRAKFFAEYAEDFRAVLDSSDPILETVELAESFIAQEKK